jgi:hypothetical protein
MNELLKLAEKAGYGMIYRKDAFGNWYIAQCAEYTIEQLEDIFKVQDPDELR